MMRQFFLLISSLFLRVLKLFKGGEATSSSKGKKKTEKESFVYYSLFIGLFLLVVILYYMLGHVKKEIIFEGPTKKETAESYDNDFLSAYKQIQTLYSFHQIEAAFKKLDELKNRPALDERENYTVYLLEAILNRAKGLRVSALESLKKARHYGEGKRGDLLEGIINLELGDEIKAEEAFLRAAKFEQGYSFAYEKLGDMFLMDGDSQKALSFYKKNADYGHDGLLKVAIAEFFLKNYQRSMEALKEAKEYYPNRDHPAMGFLFEAFNEEALKHNVEADQAYTKSISIASGQEKDFYTYFYSLFLINQKEEDKAISLLNRIISSSTEIADEAHILAGKYLYSRKDYRGSFNQFRAVYINHKQDEEIALFYGFSLFQISNPLQALDIANEVIQKSSKEKNIILAYLLKSMAYLKQKQFDKTIETIDLVKKKYGESSEFINMVGYTVLVSFDDKDQGLVFDYIINHNSAGEYDDILADYFLLRKRYNPALSIYLSKNLQNKGNIIYMRNSADVLLKVGDIKRSKGYYQEVLGKVGEENEEASPILNNLAYIYYQENNQELFFKTLQKALKLEPNNPLLYYNMAMAYKKTNEALYKSNLFRADSLVNLNIKRWDKSKDISRIYYELGLLYRSESDVKMANDAFQKALKFDSNNNLAAYRLKGL